MPRINTGGLYWLHLCRWLN